MVLLATPTIALVGNPNTGKTTLFNAIAGLKQRVGNYPGVTVETKKGKFKHGDLSCHVIDLPGTYSLAPRSPDEMVAVDVVLGHQKGEARPDLVVIIVDASNLERNLYLTTQALELGVPVVVALNMMDVAEGQGIHIDVPRLEKQLGVPVVPMQAHRNKGMKRLKEAIAAALSRPAPDNKPSFPDAFEKEVVRLRGVVGEAVPVFLVRRLLLDIGGHTERQMMDRVGPQLTAEVKAARQRLAAAGCTVPAIEARVRYGWIREATAGCIERPSQRRVSHTDRIDRVLTHWFWGTLVFLVLMLVVFESIFTGAKPLMDWIGLGQNWLGERVTDLLEPGPLRGLLVDGIIKGVGGILTFLPQIMILFGFIAILEDCGYMARAAFLMDKLMARAGLNGKSFIPLLSSVACAVPGIMAARVIENRRDRLATMLVAPLMSCAARLPVYTLLIGAFLGPQQGYPWWVAGLAMFGLYCLGLIVAPVVAFLLKSSLLRGETPVFVLEMPLYKWPSLRTIGQRMTDSGWMFVRRAGTMILASMVVIWALLYFPVSDGQGGRFDQRIATIDEVLDAFRKELAASEQGVNFKQKQALEEKVEALEKESNRLRQEWSQQSVLGQVGTFIEPAVRPLGWDGKIGMAALASFPAREVMVGTLGIIYSQGQGDSRDEKFRSDLGDALRAEPGFGIPRALSIMVFFALCCQCASTLAVIRRETNSWRWPAFTFAYMTVLAYIGALITFQIANLFT